jgi:hypothetical protein
VKNIPAVAESRKHQENVELSVKKTGLQPEVRPDFPTNSIAMSGSDYYISLYYALYNRLYSGIYTVFYNMVMP